MNPKIVLLILLGCGSDTSDSETALQCEQSGGDWVEVSDCPSACEPPDPTAEACATIEEISCIAVCGDVPICHCPEDRPFWVDGAGCVGFEACPDDADTGD